MPENVNTSRLVVGDSSLFEDDPRETVVSVDHVTMSFNMASEQLNSLKEYAIQLLKRQLFFEEFRALDDVSFEVKKGDVFGIMGTNGSGKSTILKIIAGVLDPTNGSCEVKGNIAPLIELGAGFDMDLSARENIYLNGALLGYSKQFIDEHFDEIVAFAEVEKFLDMPMKNYSSGMVSRIAFAIATIIIPDILIVDEVLSVGDFMFQKKCEDRIRELIEQHGVTVLIVSHSNEQIARLCNKAIWIEKGHVRLMGEAEEVCRIYGALGGRTGDTDAEQAIFRTIVGSSSLQIPKGLATTITGENANAICSKLVMNAWGKETPKTVALACDSTHCNSVVANALAAAYQAPVLPVGRLAIPESVEAYLYNCEPETIFIFDCGLCMKEAMDQINTLPWHPEVVVFGVNEDPFDFSCEVFDYGQTRGLWNDEVLLVSFEDNPEAMAVSPYLYARQIPAIVFAESLKDTQFANVAQNANIKEFEVLGSRAEKKLASFKETEAFSFNDYSVRMSLVAECEQAECDPFIWILNLSSDSLNHFSETHSEYVLYLASASHWFDLQSAGSVVAHEKGRLLLVDETSLESIQNTLEYLTDHKDTLNHLVFIGDGLAQSGLDEKVFCSHLL